MNKFRKNFIWLERRGVYQVLEWFQGAAQHFRLGYLVGEQNQKAHPDKEYIFAVFFYTKKVYDML